MESKILFIGKDELAEFFKILGFESLKVEDLERIKEMQDFKIILCEEDLYEKLLEKFKDRIIVPFCNLEEKKELLKENIYHLVKETIGK